MIIREFDDNCYPKAGFTTIRNSVRSLVFKDDRCAMIHIKCHDIFGERDHYEIPGGGIEFGENEYDALNREIREELGHKVVIRFKIGTVIDRWNLLQRINVHHFYVSDSYSELETQLTEYEQEVINGIEWHTPAEWLEILSKPTTGINAMIHNREICVLQEFMRQMEV